MGRAHIFRISSDLKSAKPCGMPDKGEHSINNLIFRPNNQARRFWVGIIGGAGVVGLRSALRRMRTSARAAARRGCAGSLAWALLLPHIFL